jgi:hypothetical protein
MLPEVLKNSISCMQAGLEDLNLSKWPLESRIVAFRKCLTLREVLDGLPKREGNSDLISTLIEKLSSYTELLYPEPILGTGTQELIGILDQGSGHIGRKDMFSRVLSEYYGLAGRGNDIEESSLVSLYRELPGLSGICSHLGDQYSTRPFITDVMTEMQKEREVPTRYVIDLSFKLRRALMDWSEKMIIEYPMESQMRLIDAPPYMEPIIGSGLSYNMDGYIGRPRTDLYLKTRGGPMTVPNLPGIFQVLLREELGHRPIYLNSFASVPPHRSEVDLLIRPLSHAVSMGYSLEREAEVLGHLKDMENRRDELLRDEETLVSLIEELYPLDEFVSDLEFLVTRERVLCALRSIADVRLNTGQQSIPEFIRWAHIVTGIEEGVLLNEVLDVAGSPGFHSAVHTIASELGEIGQTKMDDGISTRDFNTASTGFGYPPWRFLRETLMGI